MKNSLACATSVAITLAIASSLHAQDDSPTTNHEHLKGLEAFIGEWDLDVEINWAGKAPMTYDFRRTVGWTLGNSFIETKMTETTEGVAKVRHKSIIGWDEKTEQIKEWGFWNAETDEGAQAWFEAVVWGRGDNGWSIVREGVKGQFTIIDKDTHEYKCEFQGEDGKKNNWRFTAKRRKKASTEQAMKWLQYMVGEWTTDWSDGTKIKATWTLEAGGKAFVGRFIGSDGTKGIEVAGWQPRVGTTLVTGFGEAGNYWNLAYADFGEDTLSGTITGTLADGRSMDGTFVLKKIDNDSCRFELTGLADGEKVTLIGTNTREKK